MMKIIVKNKEITLRKESDEEYVSLTDIARIKNDKEPKDVVKNWLRNRSTLEYIGLWEKINNIDFKGVEFDPLLKEAGSNSFTISASRIISEYNVKCLKVIVSKNGGVFAHKDIALEFASWISPEVKLYIIKEFQRLKIKENNDSNWKGNRILSSLNYLIHTDAIKKHLVSVNLNKEQINYVYASVFELAILSNLEFYNAKLIENNLTSEERIVILNKEANDEKEIFNKNNLINRE